MPIDFGKLKKLEGSSAVRAFRPDNSRAKMLVLLKLRPGCDLPKYVKPRGEPAPGFCSATVSAGHLERLENDPAIESFSISQKLPGIM